MGIRITTLSENTASLGDFLAEWGLSFLIETDKVKILFDAGKGYSSVYNADTLGIDLRSIDKIVLSHGHFDHTGGLREILRRMKKKVEVIAHPDIWQLKYSRRKNEEDRFIGIPFRRSELENLGAIFMLNKNPVRIDDGIMTTGEVPMLTSYERIDDGLFVMENSNLLPDKVLDDQALIIQTGSGLVVILGCAHRGIINTLNHVRQLTGTSRIHAVIGGSHLMNVSGNRLEQTLNALDEFDIRMLGLCHCTDLNAAGFLAQKYGDSFFYNKAGEIIEIP